LGQKRLAGLAALLANRNYYATFAATGSGGTAVAAPSFKFISGQLGLTVTDGACGANGADTATIVVARWEKAFDEKRARAMLDGAANLSPTDL